MRCKILTMLATSVVLFGVTKMAYADGVIINSLSRQNGFYVGVDAGAANLTDKESHSVTPESHQLGILGPVAGGYVGYDVGVTHKFRIAAEAFFDATWLQTEIVHADDNYLIYQFYNLGVRLLPEYAFTANTAGHLIVGYANGHFKLRDSGVYGYIHSSYNAGGLQAGMGLDSALIDNFFIRLDALYNTYGSRTKAGSGLTGPGSTQSYTNRFSQLAGEFSVFYKFC